MSDLISRQFVELVVEYPDPELCTYKEYRGKPYYSIKYIENGETYVGYGTYKPEVLSRYLREYFMPSAQPERIRGRWSGFYSEPNDETHIYGEKLMEGDTVYLLGVEGYVSCECGAWGWGSPNYVPWEQLESRMPHNNAPAFCYCDNFISFWELKWNFDDGNDWDGVPYIKHHSNCGADMREGE